MRTVKSDVVLCCVAWAAAVVFQPAAAATGPASLPVSVPGS